MATTEQAQEVVAGRELDALIAERCMGWRWWARKSGANASASYFLISPHAIERRNAGMGIFEPYHTLGGITFSESDEFAACETAPAGKGYRGYDGLPHYSTDISAAWEVVEKMVRDGHVFIVKGDGLRTGDFSPRYTVLCCNLPRVDSDSAPLAICLAALKAFESAP